MIKRRVTRQVMVGSVAVGGDARISVQSMTTTKTADVDGTLAQIYALALPIADRLYWTNVDADITGDVFFPSFDQSQWLETYRESHAADERHAAAI